MLEIVDRVKHTRAAPGRDTRDKMVAYTLRAREVTRKLRREVNTVAVPDTSAAREAANYLDNFARFASGRIVAGERRVHQLPEDLTLLQSVRGLERTELELLTSFVQMTTATAVIKSEIPELREPFDSADSCKELDALDTD